MRNRSMMVLAGVLMALAVLVGPVPASADKPDAKATAKIWKAKCAACHGPDGKGKTKQGEKLGIGDMTTAEWQKEFTDEKVKTTILQGLKREKNGKAQEMKPLKDKLSADEIDAVVAYVRGLGK